MKKNIDQLLLDEFLKYISEKRKNLFLKTIEHRTKFVTIVLENIYQSQNASAVLRTSECLGIQDVHVIENSNDYKINPDVSLGADKWIDIHYYKNKNENNTISCLKKLKKEGYKIVATMPHKNQKLLTNFLPNEKIAIVFGTEKEGISEDVIQEADVFLSIPIYGFTESYNISVSAAITLYTIVENLKKENKFIPLIEKEKTEILIRWCKKTIRMSKKIEEMFIKNLKKNK
jgi:tRNA (guanosine-2'-O-)-methyltransferase